MIELLSQETIEQIAAGEVIERPVSVVKELVENAIDAGASEISVEISRGGKEKILVSDNGSGIAPEDMETAFLRHATSKIRSFDDLYGLHSLGFRGEALPSIISVARVKARSRTADQAEGLELVYEQGILQDRHGVAMPRGTQMEVEDLFGQIPVRQKFLKSDQAEGKQISNLLYPLAISRPDLSFRFIRDGSLVFQTRRENSLDDNLLILFGSAYYDSLTALEGENEDFKLTGRISDNSYYRGNRSLQYIFLNGRVIEDDAIRQAVEEEYKSIIPNGRFPAFQLFIESQPDLIDVNIHPNKRKVSIRHRESLEALLHEAVHRALFQSVAVPRVKAEEDAKKNLFADMTTEESYRHILDQYAWQGQSLADGGRPYAQPFGRQADGAGSAAGANSVAGASLEASADAGPAGEPGLEAARAADSAGSAEPAAGEEFELEDLTDLEAGPSDSAQGGSGTGARASLARDSGEEDSFAPAETGPADGETGPQPQKLEPIQEQMVGAEEADFPLMALLQQNYVGTLFRTYLLFEDDPTAKVTLIDQHAAHERINYERFMKQLKTGTVVSQKLLVPLKLQLDPNQVEVLHRRLPFFQKLGYDVDALGENLVVIREVPTLFKSPSDAMIFLNLLDLDVDQLDSFDAITDQMAMKACKASVKQGDRLSPHEVYDLVRQLAHCDYPYTCPHGRPTLIELDKAWFEKLFMRRK